MKVDDDLHDHHKARRVSLATMGVWVLCGSYAGRREHDGFVPERFVLALGDPQMSAVRREREMREHAAALVAVGLWELAEEHGESGWRFHDWLDFNPSRAALARERDAAKARKQRERNRREAERDGHAVTDAVTGGVTPP